MNQKEYELLDDIYKNKKAHTLSVSGLLAQAKQYGITRKTVNEYLKQQPDYQILQAKKKEKKTATMVRYKPGYVQTDTIDITNLESDEANYLLTFVDIFTRKLWAYPLQNKTAGNVLKQIKKFVSEYQVLHTLQSDNGKEFEGNVPAYLDFEKIKQIKSAPGNPTTNAYVEKSNHRLARALYGYKQKTGQDPIPDLQEFVDSINLVANATTKVIPEVAILPENQEKIIENVKKYNARKGPVSNKLFLPGDKVRVLLEKSDMTASEINKQKKAKGYLPRWSNEIYTIKSRNLPASEFAAPYYYLEEFFKTIFNPKKQQEQKSYKKFFQSDLLKIDDTLTKGKTHIPKYDIKPKVEENKQLDKEIEQMVEKEKESIPKKRKVEYYKFTDEKINEQKNARSERALKRNSKNNNVFP